MNVCVLCFVLPPANGSIRLGKAEVRQDRLRVGGIGSTFTNISALWRNKSRYGHASVWSSIDEKRQSAFFKHTWFEGLHAEGAKQIKYLRAFMDDMQPQLGRPCQEILPADNEDAPIDSHLQACVNGQNESVCVYFLSGGCAELDLCRVWEQEEVWLWWYRPCDGKFYADAETVTDTAQRHRTEGGRLPVCAPSSGACEDWLLLIKKEDSRAPIQVKTYYETQRVMEIKKVFEW